MKLKTLSATAALLVSAWAYYAVSQQADEVVPPETIFTVPVDQTKPESQLAVDRETWMVVDLNNPDADLSSMNTDELRMMRYKTVLAGENFEEFERQFPPTPEELARREAAIKLIENPPAVDEVLAGMAPEERDAAVVSLEKILNPQPASEE